MFALTPSPAPALDISPDRRIYSASETLPVTQSRSSWNLLHLNPAAYGGEGVVVWAWLGPTDMPSSSKVRSAWLEREIHRIHDKLGFKDRIAVTAPRHFDAAEIGGGKAFSAEFSVDYADHSFANPLYIIPNQKAQGRLVVFGLLGADAVVGKAAASFAELWAPQARDATTFATQ
jgi:hypothetical protein